MSTELLSLEQLQDLRRRYLAGEEISEEELRKALKSIRAHRAKFVTTSDRKAQSADITLEDLGL